MTTEKLYGLVLKKKSDAPAANKPGIFDDVDDDIAAPTSAPKVVVGETRVKKQVQLEHARALAEDPSVFAYDDVYDAMVAKRAEKSAADKRANQTREPKYMASLLAAAKRRELDYHAHEERVQQKERQAEGAQFNDDEVFVTGAYRKQMEDVAKHREIMDRRDALDERQDVSKQTDISGFYRHFLNDMTSDEAAAKGVAPIAEPKTEPPDQSAAAAEDVAAQKEKSYRRRRRHSDSSDSANEDARPPVAAEAADRRRSDNLSDDEHAGAEERAARPTRRDDGVTTQMKQRRFFTPSPSPPPPGAPASDKAARQPAADGERRPTEARSKATKADRPKSKPTKADVDLKPPIPKDPNVERLAKLKKILARRNDSDAIEHYRQRYFERKAKGLIVPAV